MSARLAIQQKAKDPPSMLCPCCGKTIRCGASQCGCGARFVGEPLDVTPIKVQRLGPAMTSVAILAVVIGASILATKWLAFAAVLVLWSAWRALRMAKQNPVWYGGYKTAAATLAVTIAGSAGLAAYGIAHIPQALDNYKLGQIAATQAAMYHVANSLEAYKRTGSYPDAQEYAKAIGESLPADYWGKSLKYQSKIGDLAERKKSIQTNPLPLTNFELRSAGPDGILGNDDDIVMRDGVFVASSEVRDPRVVQQLR